MIFLRRVFFCSLVSILVVSFGLHSPAWAISNENENNIFDSALESIRQQDYESAAIRLTQVIDLNERLVGVAFSDRCLVNLQLQKYLDAKSDCTIALQYNSSNLEASLNLGLAYYLLGDSKNAISQYDKVIQRDITEYRAYYNRGLGNFALQNYQAAIADYNLALTSNNDIVQSQKSLIYNDLGVTYWTLKNYNNAIANFNRAIDLETNNYDAYFNRGCANHRQKNYLAAIEDFTKVIQLNPNLTQAYVNRAMLHHKLGNNNNVFEDLDIALAQYKKQGNDLAYHQVLEFKQTILQSQPSRLA